MNEVLLLLVGAVAGSFITIMVITDNVPTAMDVYRGKTTLEYTVRDGVVKDSVVVFKSGHKYER